MPHNPSVFADIEWRHSYCFDPMGQWGACVVWSSSSPIVELCPIGSAEATNRRIPLPVDVIPTQVTFVNSHILAIVGSLAPDSFHVLRVNIRDLDKDIPYRYVVAVKAYGARVVRGPNGSSWHLLITTSAEGTSTIWQLDFDQCTKIRLVSLDAILTEGTWFDHGQHWLVNWSTFKKPSRAVAINLNSGTTTELFNLSEKTSEKILNYEPRSDTAIVASDIYGCKRIGLATIKQRGKVRFLPRAREQRFSFDQTTGLLSPDAKTVLIREQQGARSYLRFFRKSDFQDQYLPLEGHFDNALAWNGRHVLFSFSSPTLPPTYGRFDCATNKTTLQNTQGSTLPFHVHDAICLRIPTSQGELEAVCYRSQRTSSGIVVMALHGGPIGQWFYDFNPLFQMLVDLGCIVIAPNVRGSTGYGRAFTSEIVDNWGGPDVGDLVSICHYVQEHRIASQIVLLGASYGAYLGLLTAAKYPTLYSAVIALSPFISIRQLYQTGRMTTRRLLDSLLPGSERLRVLEGVNDLFDSLVKTQAKLLILHGIDDKKIPVQQSRRLVNHLLVNGKVQGLDLHYMELQGGHALMQNPSTRRAAFLTIHEFMQSTVLGKAARWVRKE